MQTMALCLLMIYSLFHHVWCQPTYVYDGITAVNISGATNDGTTHYNWTFKYPLGFLCEDPNWVKTLIINITALTSQADLILAFGTNLEYFALAIPYDGRMRIPLKLADGTSSKNTDAAYSGLSVAPPPNSPLYTATTTLEEQYTTETDFRYSLIPSKDPWEWYHLINKTHPLYEGPLSQNAEQLTLRIFGDRQSGLHGFTQLTITKSDTNITTQMSSTWPFGQSQDIFLFMGMDAAIGQQEIFFIHGITSIDECTIQTIPTAPTTPSPTQPTVQPTTAPITSFPTQNPSNTPTPMPSAVPTEFPSIAATANPTLTTSDPSVSPSRVPVVSPTLYPSTSPTDDPTLSPTDNPTRDPSIPPSKGPVREAPVVDDTTDAPESTSSDSEGDSEKESMEAGQDGLEGMIISPMIVGIAVGCCVLICVVVAVVIYIRKMKKKKAQMEAMFGIDSDEVCSSAADTHANSHDAQQEPQPPPEPVKPIHSAVLGVEMREQCITKSDAREEAMCSNGDLWEPPDDDEKDAAATSDTMADDIDTRLQAISIMQAPDAMDAGAEATEPISPTTGPCTDCGLVKTGKVYDDDQLFYCNDCFSAYET